MYYIFICKERPLKIKKKGHGGKRPGAGPKTKDQAGEKRVPLMARVRPETKTKIDTYSRAKKVSRGEAIDDLVGDKK